MRQFMHGLVYCRVPVAIALVVLTVGMWPEAARAQDVASQILGKRAVGIGVFWGVGNQSLEAPPQNASAEVKGYTDALPTDIEGAGPAVGLSFGTFGLIFGMDDNTLNVKKYADVNQTPANSADDVYVISARRINRSITLVWQPHPVMGLGIGQDAGTVEFRQINADGSPATRKLSYENQFYSLALFAGFDPTKHQVAPILTVFAKIPAARGNFTGTVKAVGVGPYF